MYLPDEHPGMFVVGDYLFDSTLNGVLDSADIVSDLVLSRLLKVHYQQAFLFPSAPRLGMTPTRAVNHDRQYFDTYRGLGAYADTYQRFFSASYLIDMIRLIWGANPGYRLLDAGSASGLTLEDFAAFGAQAWGIENNKYIYAHTPDKLLKHNVFGNVLQLHFARQLLRFRVRNVSMSSAGKPHRASYPRTVSCHEMRHHFWLHH